MEYIKLRKTDLSVSRLCMGGCPMGQYGWGQVQENELIQAVNVAVDNGVNFFDTADAYGLGKAEETLAKALGGRRKDVFIASKFGVRIENGKTYYDNSPAWIEEALKGSLQRLKTDYIDLYQIHYRDGKTPITAVVETLERLRSEGFIRYYGLSNIHESDVEEINAAGGRFVSMQDEYSLACRKNEYDLTVTASTLGVTPMTWGSLGQGVLTGKYSKDAAFGSDDRRSREVYVNFHGEMLDNNLRIVDAMRPIAESHGVTIPAVAIRFILDRLKDSVVLVGVKRPSQILSNTEATDWHLTDDELKILDEVSGYADNATLTIGAGNNVK